MISEEKSAYVSNTRGIKVSVWPEFNSQQSRPEASLYIYNYTIRIDNESTEQVQLLTRHWEIRDGFDRVEHVIGEGVVGEQPILSPGESFTYSSSCPLLTPTGSMKGSFKMKGGNEQVFDAQIEEFHLLHKSLLN